MSDKLPEGFISVEKTKHSVVVKSGDMPWAIQKGSTDTIRLNLVNLEGRFQFFLGSFIKGTPLKVIDKYSPEDSKILNDLLYSHLRAFIGGQTGIPKLQFPNSDRDIPYFKAKNNARVYFMRFDNLNNLPVIIKIAGSLNNNDESRVLNALAMR